MNLSRYHYAQCYLNALMFDPGASFDAARLFKGPEGRRWAAAALGGVLERCDSMDGAGRQVW